MAILGHNVSPNVNVIFGNDIEKKQVNSQVTSAVAICATIQSRNSLIKVRPTCQSNSKRTAGETASDSNRSHTVMVTNCDNHVAPTLRPISPTCYGKPAGLRQSQAVARSQTSQIGLHSKEKVGTRPRQEAMKTLPIRSNHTSRKNVKAYRGNINPEGHKFETGSNRCHGNQRYGRYRGHYRWFDSKRRDSVSENGNSPWPRNQSIGSHPRPLHSPKGMLPRKNCTPPVLPREVMLTSR